MINLSLIRFVRNLRPAAIHDAAFRIVLPTDRRSISSYGGLRYYLDPASNLGWTLLNEGHYEIEIENTIKSLLRTGDVAFDIGANEVFFPF